MRDRILALLPSWIFLWGQAHDLPLRPLSWCACAAAILALILRADKDDVMAGINWNFALMGPVIEALFAVGAYGPGLVVVENIEAFVCVSITVILIWRLQRPDRRWERLALTLLSAAGSAALFMHPDAGPAELAPVIVTLFLAQTLMERIGMAGSAGFAAVALNPDELL